MWPSMPSRKKWHQTYCRHRTTSEKTKTSVCHGLFDWKHHGDQRPGCIGPRLGQQGRVWCVLECTRGRQRNLSTRSRGVVERKRTVSCYPALSKLAQQYLGIPATSVPLERVSSTTGNIVNHKKVFFSDQQHKHADIFLPEQVDTIDK